MWRKKGIVISISFSQVCKTLKTSRKLYLSLCLLKCFKSTESSGRGIILVLLSLNVLLIFGQM